MRNIVMATDQDGIDDKPRRTKKKESEHNRQKTGMPYAVECSILIGRMLFRNVFSFLEGECCVSRVGC